MTDSPDRTATAYHEAGHAVIALSLGRDIHRVSIKANHLRLGHCQTKKGAFRPSQDVIETEILILLGGLAAEARHTGVHNHDAAYRDLADVRAMTRLRGGSERQIERLERRMLSKVEHLLEQPGIWQAITKIADALIREEAISGRAARHLFEEARRIAEG